MSREYGNRPYSSNYPSRRYQDPRDYRNSYEEKRDKMDNTYDDKFSRRNHNPRDQYSSQTNPNQSEYGSRYDIHRATSSGYFDRESHWARKYSYEQEEPMPNPRIPSEITSKRDRSSTDYVYDHDNIAELIKKEYQVNPPIQLNLPKPFLDMKFWD